MRHLPDGTAFAVTFDIPEIPQSYGLAVQKRLTHAASEGGDSYSIWLLQEKTESSLEFNLKWSTVSEIKTGMKITNIRRCFIILNINSNN